MHATRALRRAGLLVLLAACQAPVWGTEVTVAGRVVSSGEQGIAGARVSLWPIPSRYRAGLREAQGKEPEGPAATAASDAQGHFVLTAPAPGLWEVVVEAAGRVPMRRPVVPLFEDATLPQVEMPADAGCRVRLLDPDGRPVTGARVRVEALWADGSPQDWEPAERRAVTGSGGVARLPRARTESLLLHALAPGLPAHSGAETGSCGVVRLVRGSRRTVEVRSQATRPVAGAVVRALPGGFVLGVTGASGQLEVDLPPGGEAALEVDTPGGRRGTFGWRAAADPAPVRVLRLPPPAPLSGQVLDRESRLPLAGAFVWPASDPGRAVRSDKEGGFRWRTVQEDEEIGAAFPGYASGSEGRTGKASLPISLQPSFTLFGTVVDEAGGPLAGTEIRVALLYGRPGDSSSEVRRLTGDGGAFRVSGLQRSAAYTVRASHPGFALSALTIATPRQRPLPPLQLVLKRGRTAFGRVEDKTGRPVEGARIGMTLAESADGGLEREQDVPHQATSGPDGGFEVSSLPAGWFSLRVTGPGLAPLERSGVRVPADTERTDLGRFPLTSIPPLTGKVLDPAGRPVAGAEIWLGPWDQNERASQATAPAATTGPDGGFVIRDLPDEDGMRLDFCRKGFKPTAIQLREPPVEPVRAVLEPEGTAGSLAGRVLDASGAPVGGARVTIGRGVSDDFINSPCLPGTWGGSDGEGFFSFAGLPPGVWSIGATAKGYQDSELKEVTVGPGEQRQGIEIALQPAAVITGRVFDSQGAPADGVHVSIGQRDSYVTTGPDGGYRMEGIDPGEQTVKAQGSWDTAARGTLDVQPGENRLDLTLTPEERRTEVRGRVLGPDGAPVAGAEVWLQAAESSSISLTYSAADGSFSFSEVERDREIWAEKEGWVHAKVHLDGGAADGVVLRLERAGAVTGHLLGSRDQEPGLGLVSAEGEGKVFHGFVDAQGEYRIPNLPPGEWRVSALAGTWKAAGQIVLRPGEPEAVLDLTLAAPAEEKP